MYDLLLSHRTGTDTNHNAQGVSAPIASSSQGLGHRFNILNIGHVWRAYRTQASRSIVSLQSLSYKENSCELAPHIFKITLSWLTIAYIQCDGKRPVCGVCKKRSVKNCVYTEKRKPNDDAIEFLKLLQVLPENRAKDMLGLLRLYGDPTVVLSLTRNNSRDNQEPSPVTSEKDGTLILKSPMESELMAKNPVMFPELRSIPKRELEQSHLLHPVDTTLEKLSEQSYVPSCPNFDL